MSNKKPANRVVIERDDINLDQFGTYVYRCTFYNDDVKYITHIERLGEGRTFDLDEFLEQKLSCCYTFDKNTLVVEDVNLFQYEVDRSAEYPPIEEFIDGWVKDDIDQMNEYKAKCLAVKAKYPKPE